MLVLSENLRCMTWLTLVDLIWLITISLYFKYLDGAFFIGFLWGFRERLSKVGPKGKTLSELFVRCLTLSE
jgi:hypothetical protein